MPAGKPFRLMPWLLVLLPLWLICSGAFALVKYFRAEETKAIKAEQRFSRSVSADLIADDLRKLVTVIGERNTGKPKALSATASMIEGLLGPSNTGYQVDRIDGPAEFPILTATVPSLKSSTSPVWLITSYDSPRGSRGAEKNATGLAATLALAQAMADSKPSHPIRFLFLPHANDTEAPLLETASIALTTIQAAPLPKAILCIEAMGDSETLILTSRDTEVIPTTEFNGLGKVLGAEITCLGDDFDIASTLFEMGLPAIRIATRPTLLPDEEDEKIPFAPTLAASTGKLIELVKRLSR